MENNTENYNNEIVFAIDSAITAEDDLLRKSFYEIFALPLPKEVYDVLEKGNSYATKIALGKEIEARINKVSSQFTRDDGKKFQSYLEIITSLIQTLLLEDNTKSKQSKAVALRTVTEIIEADKFIHKSENDPLVIRYADFIDKENQKYKQYDNGISIKNLLKKNEEEISIYLFDEHIIRKLDLLLRKDHINTDSSPLIDFLQKNDRKENLPLINWRRKQDELCYLFCLLNEESRNLGNAYMSKLIVETFKRNNKELKKERIATSFSKVTKYLQKKISKPQRFIDLQIIYDKAVHNSDLKTL
jgi:hypothetical protein